MVAGYKLKIPHETAGFIKSLHPDLKSRVKAALKSILQDPHSGKALKDELNGLRSFRIRGFRLIYRVSSGKIVEIIAIGPRKNIYEETFRLVSKKGKK
ncbi:cytotoxin [Desulfobacteraceae bacterium SEEP-SAG9]|nr:cytotoxin [Desulfobacteraceae bacterium SEEP-SAG9]